MPIGARAAIDSRGAVSDPDGPTMSGHGHQVQPDAEVGPSGRDDHRPDLRVRRRWRAMARGRSDQKAGPRALRFSGRSSHRVAT